MKFLNLVSSAEAEKILLGLARPLPEDLVRVRILPDGRAEPILGKSGLLNTLVRSDGYIRVPAGLDGCEAGEVAEVYLWQ